jgi:hypothetical protein
VIQRWVETLLFLKAEPNPAPARHDCNLKTRKRKRTAEKQSPRERERTRTHLYGFVMVLSSSSCDSGFSTRRSSNGASPRRILSSRSQWNSSAAADRPQTAIEASASVSEHAGKDGSTAANALMHHAPALVALPSKSSVKRNSGVKANSGRQAPRSGCRLTEAVELDDHYVIERAADERKVHNEVLELLPVNTANKAPSMQQQPARAW